ncbi:hypothetical protein M0804_008559 [Polistes exclamans]|nr:hypothetical protein M0804_008559 [Polistes exclamans]
MVHSNGKFFQNRTGLCRIGIARSMSSMQTIQPGSLPDYQIDPYRLVEDDLKLMYHQIRTKTIVSVHVIKRGKRNIFMTTLTSLQQSLAMYVEMIHNGSLLHDDVIDQAEYRRGKPSANVLWNQQQVTLAGNYILTVATILLARYKHDEIIITLAEIVSDLVKGELMQLGSKETENERFAHYLNKTFRKTASMMANSLKATAQAVDVNDEIIEIAYQYGRNIGIAFQLVDDFLDFVASSAMMGKKTAVDLKLGLATAPVLFACEQYPELNAMIMRRFQEPNDVDKAYELVHKSHGLDQTKFLARKHCAEAARLIQSLAESPYQKALIVLTDLVINRIK